MKISKISLENFKCFEKIDLELGKLTILTGANSSGKSSIIYSIISAFQSGAFPMKYSLNGKYVNMGDFEDISYCHKRSNVVKMGYEIDRAGSTISLETHWIFDRTRKQPKFYALFAKEKHYNLSITTIDSKLEVSFSYDSQKDDSSEFNKFEFQYELNKMIYAAIDKSANKKLSSEKYLKKLELRFKRNKQRIKFTINSIDELRNAIIEKGSFALEKAYEGLMQTFRQIDINYISSFRANPQKLRFEVSKNDLRVSKYGENYEDQILEWDHEKSNNYSKLISNAKRMKLFDDLRIYRRASGNYELKIKTHSQGVFSSLTDVGFGISQFLPIVVADIQLPNNSTLFISQPEIHLHPSIQSDFGDYLIEEIKQKKKNYVIETHSEYLLNKIRLLIVQKKIKPEDVKVYYFKKDKNNVEKHLLELTTNGEIKNAPEDFFSTYMTDVMSIALNA